ncbi:MAG TPA: 1-deoxy-D-xylulose-5-phosphate synthase N-terminal domain-containing protein, partial [Luteolibacter sp.]|nr:1-deoxy-D-xylulose-5-phosphate synthase N-terminal domain-containing protein [Luteolibacter sp.]
MTSASSEPNALGPLLGAIRSPDDVKKLAAAQLPELAEEVRRTLITALSKTGGHLG